MPDRAIHAAGYCLGGTLLSIAAARLQRERPDCLRTVTLLAAQTDFTEAGELTLFINESQVAFLEDMMWQRGILGPMQMAGAFQMLRSNDLLWSRLVHDYLIGERSPASDLMSWNADATRLPYRMHSDYLRHLFLDNDLAEGRYQVDGKPIALSDLRKPMFVVGTLRDHVAPWKSVHKIHFLADADITFVLASGGHNAGIVAAPDEEEHSYQVLTKKTDGPYVGPDEWIKLRAVPRRIMVERMGAVSCCAFRLGRCATFDSTNGERVAGRARILRDAALTTDRSVYSRTRMVLLRSSVCSGEPEASTIGQSIVPIS